MRTATKKTLNVHGRINHRANIVNQDRCYGLLLTFATPPLIIRALDLNNGKPKTAELYRFERGGQYNDHRGFYN